MIHWSREDIGNLTGKLCIVTGGNRGIGLQVTKTLAEKGATVIMGVRSLDKGRRVAEEIQLIYPEAKIIPMELDLSDLKSIESFANQYHKKFQSLSILINNASTFHSVNHLTKDGFESHFGVNFLGHYALTGLLLPHLLSTPQSRVVTVGCHVPNIKKVTFQYFHKPKHNKTMNLYKQSKIACLFFSKTLDELFLKHKQKVISVASQPNTLHQSIHKKAKDVSKKLMKGPIPDYIEQNSIPILYAATHDNVKGGTSIRMDNKGFLIQQSILDGIYHRDVAHNLWMLAEQFSNVRYKFT